MGEPMALSISSRGSIRLDMLMFLYFAGWKDCTGYCLINFRERQAAGEDGREENGRCARWGSIVDFHLGCLSASSPTAPLLAGTTLFSELKNGVDQEHYTPNLSESYY